uniref:Uncharacterized protein n=1 Tax=Lepeophtheirus salmonis TaxID=72036 RepID=A0A0K2UA10_LEPSM
MDNKSKDLGNLNADNGCVGSESVQDSDKGETNDTDPGKGAITATSKTVLIPPQRLEDAEEYWFEMHFDSFLMMGEYIYIFIYFFLSFFLSSM